MKPSLARTRTESWIAPATRPRMEFSVRIGKEIWSPIQFASPGLDASFDGTLAVENHYDFANLRDCKVTWQLRCFPAMNESQSDFAVFARGSADTPDLAPHAAGSLRLKLPADWSNSDALAVTV